MPQTPLCQRQVCISELVIVLIIKTKRNFNNREKFIFAISSGWSCMLYIHGTGRGAASKPNMDSSYNKTCKATTASQLRKRLRLIISLTIKDFSIELRQFCSSQAKLGFFLLLSSSLLHHIHLQSQNSAGRLEREAGANDADWCRASIPASDLRALPRFCFHLDLLQRHLAGGWKEEWWRIEECRRNIRCINVIYTGFLVLLASFKKM